MKGEEDLWKSQFWALLISGMRCIVKVEEVCSGSEYTYCPNTGRFSAVLHISLAVLGSYSLLLTGNKFII
jgi:hypothetical protein